MLLISCCGSRMDRSTCLFLLWIMTSCTMSCRTTQTWCLPPREKVPNEVKWVAFTRSDKAKAKEPRFRVHRLSRFFGNCLRFPSATVQVKFFPARLFAHTTGVLDRFFPRGQSRGDEWSDAWLGAFRFGRRGSQKLRTRVFRRLPGVCNSPYSRIDAPARGHNETNRADVTPYRPVVVAVPHSPPSRASHATREGVKARSAEAFASSRKLNAARA